VDVGAKRGFSVALAGCEEEPFPASEPLDTSSIADSSIVPNPVADQTELRYSVTGEGRVRLEITDATGRTLISQDEGSRSTGDYVYDWDTTPLTPGTYHCALYMNDERLVKTALKVSTQ
jgi:flagellar hook assembly protein FlgD